ncbi:MAG: VOC family protein [Chitinophagaceae bacterium]
MKIHFITLRIIIPLLIMTTFKVSAQVKKPPTLNHIAVYVYDLKKSTDFYQNIIGLTIIPEPFHDGRHSWFKIGDHSQLHLIQGAVSVTEHDKNSHLCFSVTSIDSFIMVLNKNSIWFGNFPGQTNMITTRPDGIKQIYFKDPDGYWIEVNDDPY